MTSEIRSPALPHFPGGGADGQPVNPFVAVIICDFEGDTAFSGITGNRFAVTGKADNIAFPSSFKSEAGVGTVSWVALGAGSWMSSFAPSLTPSKGLQVGRPFIVAARRRVALGHWKKIGGLLRV